MEVKSAHNKDLVGQFQIEEHALKGVDLLLRDHPPAFGLLIERPQKVWPVNCRQTGEKPDKVVPLVHIVKCQTNNCFEIVLPKGFALARRLKHFISGTVPITNRAFTSRIKELYTNYGDPNPGTKFVCLFQTMQWNDNSREPSNLEASLLRMVMTHRAHLTFSAFLTIVLCIVSKTSVRAVGQAQYFIV